MGRRPLKDKIATHSTVVRLPLDMRAEIEEIAGPNRMAEFIREAVAEKIERAKAAKPPED